MEWQDPGHRAQRKAAPGMGPCRGPSPYLGSGGGDQLELGCQVCLRSELEFRGGGGRGRSSSDSRKEAHPYEPSCGNTNSPVLAARWVLPGVSTQES